MAGGAANSRVAVVLFNLGGPDSPDAIRPFLFNLFSDPAIIGLPSPLRRLLAWTIARRRAPVAAEIYAHLGGASPLLRLTREQASALERALASDIEARVFVSMRYWHPFSRETAAEVRKFDPGRIVLLPLYPQYSTTTSASSLADWVAAARREGLTADTRAICCYPEEPGFVAELAARTRAGLDEAAAFGRPRILFSAHGLPKRVVESGDPYAWQVERTAEAVARELASGADPGGEGGDELDWRVCYQSRVGPMAWIGPSTEDELGRAAADGVPVVVVPLAFVSEHSETLVELDIEYRDAARRLGVPGYVRVPTVGTGERFIDGLAALVRASLEDEERTVRAGSGSGGRLCPLGCGRCAQARSAGREERTT